MTLQEKPEFDNIIKFLCGEASFYGLWFGDLHPSEPGQFWWRKHLKAHVEPLQKENKKLTYSLIEVTKGLLEIKIERDKLKSENEILETQNIYLNQENKGLRDMLMQANTELDNITQRGN